MLIKKSNLVPNQLLDRLTPKYFVQSYRTSPIRLEIDVMPAGSWFLNLYISRIGVHIYRFLVEVSEERLLLISRGELTVDYSFLHPENGIFYAALFDEESQIFKLSIVDPVLLAHDNPIPQNQYLSFELDLAKTSFNILEHAKKRGKIVIEVKSESKVLRSNLQYGSVRNLLIPFSELIKTAILDHNPRLSPKKVEDHLGFGFSYMGIGSLHTLVEFNFHADLFGGNQELDNLAALFALFRADDPQKISEAIGYFKNKKVLPDYIRLLNSVNKSGSGYVFKMASPIQEYPEICFDWARAQIIMNIIEASMPVTEYDEVITGILTCLDFENRKRPAFSLSSVTEDRIYNGFIDPGLDGVMNVKNFQFCRKVYDCTLRVMILPESIKKEEQYRYILLRIEEVEEREEILEMRDEI